MSVTHLPHVLFDWWRADCAQLPEGEEMPSEEERAHALAVIRTHTEEELLPMLRFMARRRWFQGDGLAAGDFAVWLEDLRTSREEGEKPMSDNSTAFTEEEGAALLAAAAVILTAPDPHPMAVKRFHILEAAGRKLAGMIGTDWERVKRIVGEGPR